MTVSGSASESTWAEEISQRWKQPKGEDRADMEKEAKLLRCTGAPCWMDQRGVQRGSTWEGTKESATSSLEWSRDWGRRKWRNSSTKRPRKDGDLQRMQRESPMKEQAVRIVSKHQEEFLWQSTATWEQLEQKKGRLSRSQEMKEELPKHGWTSEKDYVSAYLWHSEGWSPRNEALEAVLKRARTTRHPWLTACDAHMSRRLRE